MSKINENENNVKNNILNLKKTFFSALDDFKQNYVNYNLYRNVDEYKNIYYANKEQLQELNSKLYDLIEQIKGKISYNHSNNQREIESVAESKKTLNVSMNDLKNISDKHRASGVLIDDYDEIYNKHFYENFQIIIGIGILMAITYKMRNI
jgi:hypothetical protein